MKKLKKTILMILAAILFSVSAPAEMLQNSFVITTEAAAPNAVTISAKKKTLYVGKSFTLKIKGTSKTVKWSSNNKSVATVSAKGKVTAKKVGTATITAKVGGKKLNCKVTVKNAPATTTYILNTNTHKFHRTSCMYCSQISPENYQRFRGTRKEVI